MATIRKHWKLTITSLVLLSCAGVSALLLWPGDGNAVGDEPSQQVQYAELERIDYDRIRLLRGQILLSNQDLAAAGCSEARAEEVLAAIRRWYTANKDTLTAKLRAEGSARRNLRKAVQRMHAGSDDANLMTSIRDLGATARQCQAECKALTDSLMSTVESTLSDTERAVYRAGRTNVGTVDPYRYLADLTAPQAGAIRKAGYRRAFALASAQTAAARTAARQQYSAAIDSALTVAQRQSLDAIRQRIATAMRGVLAAEAKVLPRPEPASEPEILENRPS